MASGLALTLVLLFAHAWQYRFLTDDAFISFRYARNLSHGDGLVFNPGGERVEGYSNFLWVLFLAGLDRLGLSPDRAANALSLLATIGLWGVMAAWLLRRPAATGREWLVLLPLFFLAATRSVAVWSTGGLETRLFELLVVAATLRLVDETERWAHGESPGRPLAAALFGLAALTRPEGMLFAGCALVTSAVYLGAIGRLEARRFALRLWPCVLLVGGLVAFRWIYYHDWVPNTFHAKVGSPQWSSGFRYPVTFALEYGSWMWAALVALAVVRGLRERASFLALLVGALTVPYLVYVAAVGGDHFEYRPLGVVIVLVFLLGHEGARHWCTSRGRTIAFGAYAGLLTLGLVWLPLETHRQFPPRYLSGFPGAASGIEAGARAFLDPSRTALARTPGFASIAAAHRARLRELTSRFVGVRQEEHRAFLAEARDAAAGIDSLIERGILPRDVRLAMNCVGVIPYVTGAWTLDRLGLTDSTVARSAAGGSLMAHQHMATLEYAKQRQVDLWFSDPMRLVCRLTSWRMYMAIHEARTSESSVVLAEIEPTQFILCQLPQGLDETRRRIPRVHFRALRDTLVQRDMIARMLSVEWDSPKLDPADLRTAKALTNLLFKAGRISEARHLSEQVVHASPEDGGAYVNLAVCQVEEGDTLSAIQSFERALPLTPRNEIVWTPEMISNAIRNLGGSRR